MNDLVRFFILWGPTFLFLLIILIGFIVGLIRGFRKSFILFIHMIIIGCICLGFYAWFVSRADLDAKMVSFVNSILGNFGSNSLQSLLKVSSEHETLHAMLMEYVIKNMSGEELIKQIIVDNGASIQALVEMAYRLVIFIVMLVVYLLLIFLCYLIYLIAYPVRRTKKKYNRKFEAGEVPHPYKKRRLFGGLVGLGRSLIVGVISFSFLGGLIWVVTGGDTLPAREQIRGKNSEEVSFNDENFNTIYDYYSTVCEMSDTGIFKVLNGLKDSNQTPFYFYISDLVLQGRIQNEELNIDDKFYLRDEMGEYVKFVKRVMTTIVKYSTQEELDAILSQKSQDDVMNALISIMGKEGFADEMTTIIDEFEAKPFMSSLCLSSLTSLVNHIELAVKDEKMVGLVNALFKQEDSIKVTDLATEQDVKNLFKAVISVVADSNGEIFEAGENMKVGSIIGYAKDLVPTIKNLSLFQDRKTEGNKLIANLYDYCATDLVGDQVELPEIPEDIDWVQEFNILLDSSTPLLEIAEVVYDENADKMIDNLLGMFNETQPKREFLEEQYDLMTNHLCQSSLIDVVFKSSYVGKTIKDMLVSMTKNEEAGIPMNIEFSGENGEIKILLGSLKVFLKNGGDEIYHEMTNSEKIDGATIAKIFELLSVTVEEETNERSTPKKLIDKLLESKLVHYMLSSFIVYSDFGDFKIYAPSQITEEIESYRVIKDEEIKTFANVMVSCKDVVVKIVDDPEHLDYAEILSDQGLLEALSGVEQSILLKGTIANLIIENAAKSEMIVLPAGYDDPEEWLKGETDEIDSLVESLKTLVEEKTEDGDSLINVLLSSGEINAKAVLGISTETINKLFGSKVLRYTISSAIQTIDLAGYTLIIPASDVEEFEAATTTGSTLNVIKEASLSGSIGAIKQVIKFDENDNPSLDEPKIFEIKKNIVENGILRATIINVLMQIAKEGTAGIAIPKTYADDFDKIKTEEDLTGNVWVPENNVVDETATPTTNNGELYFILDVIQNIFEVDADSDFSFENLDFDSLQLTKPKIMKLKESEVLLTTVSKYIEEVEQIYIPLSVTTKTEIVPLQSVDSVGVISSSEYDHFMDNVFDLLADENGQITINNINVDGIKIKASTIDKITTSEILCATVSKYVTDIEEVVVLASSVTSLDLTNGKQTYVIKHSQDDNELKNMLTLMIDLFGVVEENETEKSLDMNAIDINTLKISETNIPSIISSGILCATMSKYIVDIEDVVVPISTTDQEDTINTSLQEASQKAYVIKHSGDNSELERLLKLMIDLFGTVEAGSTVKTLDVNNIDTSQLILDLESKKEVTGSVIMRATLSNFLTNNAEQGIIVPDDEVIIDKDVPVVRENASKSIVKEEELNSLLDIAFDLFAVEGKLNVKDVKADSMVITKDNAAMLSESEIINATIMDNLLGFSEIIVPSSVSTSHKVINETDKTCYVTEENELKTFLTSMIDLIGENGTIQTGAIAINVITLSSDIKVTESEILNATLGYKISSFAELVIPNNVMLVNQDTLSKTESVQKSFIEANELDCLIQELILIAGTPEPGQTVPTKLVIDTKNTSDSLGNDKLKINKSLLEDNTFLSSKILNSTISTKITTDDVFVEKSLDNIVTYEQIYSKESQEYILKSNETKAVLLGLMSILETDELTVDSAQSGTNLDTITITKEKMDVIYQSQVLTDTISEKMCNSDSLEKPYDNVTSKTTISDVSKFVINKDELQKLFDAIFILTDNQLSIVNGSANIDVSTLEISSTDLPALLKSDIFATTMSKEMFVSSVYIPNDTEVVETKAIYDMTSQSNQHDQVVLKNQHIQDAFNGLLAFLNRSSVMVSDLGNVNSFKQVPTDETRLTTILNSVVIKTTIGHSIMEASSLEKPTNIYQDMSLYNGTTTTTEPVVIGDEVEKVFDSLLVSTPAGATEIDFGNFSLDAILLPTDSTKAQTLVTSYIVAATISREIMNIDPTSIVILDESIDNYGTMKDYLKQTELSSLVLALSIGLGKTDVSNLSFTKIDVPNSDSPEEQALLGSTIIRATISRTVMRNDIVKIFENSSSYELKSYQSVSSIVFNTIELNNLIKGLEAVTAVSGTKDFEAIDFDLMTILGWSETERKAALNAIAASDIYRTIISEKLMFSATTYKLYETLVRGSSMSGTETIDGITYNYVLGTIGYHIQDPTSNVSVYTQFTAGNTNKETNFSLFAQIDIKALGYLN